MSFTLLLSFLLAATSLVFATPILHNRANASVPTAVVKNGTYTGIHNAAHNQDFFLGIPFAQPPVGNLRLRNPVPLNTTFDTVAATSYPPECVGYGSDDTGYETSEDCLYLNVIRPAGIAENEKLPVGVWIHGGGLYEGGTPDLRYNLSFIVDNGVKIGKPIMAVSIQYRLSGWGFLGGSEALAGGATNLGFRDQRLALHWLQENIASFGGDPSAVTIWGESAGGQSVGAQLLAYGGRDDKLFRGAIAESGGPMTIYVNSPGLLNSTAQQIQYGALVEATGCSDADDTLECLRELPFNTYNNVLNATYTTGGGGAFSPVLDGDFVETYPSDLLNSGRIPPVSLLIGANSDEGVAFGSQYYYVDTDEEFVAAIQNFSNITYEMAAPFLDYYPNDPAVGIPSLTTFPGNYSALGYGSQVRRVFAYFGDQVIFSTRRFANLAWAAAGIPTYSYRFDVTVNGIPSFVGATHFQEVAYMMDNEAGLGYATDPIATEVEKRLAKQMSQAWASFIHSGDPNSGVPGAVHWPEYGQGQKEIVWSVTGPGNGSWVGSDDYRSEGIEYMISIARDGYGR